MRRSIWPQAALGITITLMLLLLTLSIPNSTAIDGAMIPPVARFDPSRGSVVLKTNVSFDASSSYDPNGLNLTYIWDFDAYDGFQEEASGVKVEHIFDRVGIFKVTLKVSNGNLSSIYRKEIFVYSGGKVYPPIAQISHLGSTVQGSIDTEAGLPMLLSASDSFDPNSERLYYEWKVNNGDNGTGDIFQYTFDQEGTYTVVLTTTTENGRTDSTSVTINVGESSIVEPGPDNKENGNGWLVFLVILIIVIILALAAGLGYMIYNRRTRSQEVVPEVEPSRRQRTMEKRTVRRTREKAQPSLAELKRKEKRLQKELDKEMAELESETKNPFSGLKDIISGKKEEEPETSIPVRKPKGASSRPPVKQPPVKRSAERQPPARTSRRRSKEEELKEELDKETSKLESFLSDILSSSKDDESKEDAKPLPPPKVKGTNRTPTRSLPPSRSSSGRKTPQNEEDLKKELKKMEQEMDKEISSLFKKF